MKNLTLAAAFIGAMMTTPAAAQTSAETCTRIANDAATIMTWRQQGLRLSDVMAGQVDAFHPLILAAYSFPQFSTDEYQQRAITEFANDIMLECMGLRG